MMSTGTIVLRRNKGSALTHEEMDDNLEYLINIVDSLFGQVDVRLQNVEAIAISTSLLSGIYGLEDVENINGNFEFAIYDVNGNPWHRKVSIYQLAQYIQEYIDEAPDLPEAYEVGSYVLAGHRKGDAIAANDILPGSKLFHVRIGNYGWSLSVAELPYDDDGTPANYQPLPGTWRAMGEANESIYKGNVPIELDNPTEPDLPMTYFVPCLFMRIA